MAVSSRPGVGPIGSADLDLYTPQPVTPTLPAGNVVPAYEATTPVPVPWQAPAVAAPSTHVQSGGLDAQAAGAPATAPPAPPREAGALKRVTPKPWTPPTTVPVAVVPASGIWACIIRHESGGNPKAVNRSSGASGILQFLPSTWHAMGMSGEAADYPASVQMTVGYRLQAQQGWRPWVGDGCTPLG